ncbi:hypothetical protein Glove_52g130 [Diversispora epigaea]|uniref:Uncharacterized protein n=1 Tax=Diversispora epigaea TaxID=1348612 RepID=A0A397JN49_9GLOM|nr:hypothetical protein Glove_52g130 [Diversispora epigaea]
MKVFGTNNLHKYYIYVGGTHDYMLEVITGAGETPHGDCDHNSDLAFTITSGYRSKICENISLEYTTLIKQYWDTNPNNKSDAIIILNKMKLLVKLLYEEMDKQQEQSKNLKSKIKNFFTSSSTKNKDKQVIKNIQSNENKGSKIYKSKPVKNTTDEEQQAFDFEISEEMEQQYLKSIGN